MPDGVNYLLRVFCKNSKLCSNQATQNPVWLALFLKLKKFFKKSLIFGTYFYNCSLSFGLLRKDKSSF